MQGAGIATITKTLKVRPCLLADRTLRDDVAAMAIQAGVKNVSFVKA